MTLSRREKLRRYLLDLGERVVKTFLQVFLGQVFVAGTEIGPNQVVDAVQNWSSIERAFLAGVGAVAALLTGLLARWAWSPNTASMLPPDLQPKPEAGQTLVYVLVVVILVVILFRLL